MLVLGMRPLSQGRSENASISRLSAGRESMRRVSAAYLDESGTPVLRASICGFLDVLGFSNLSTVSSSRQDAQRVLERVSCAIAGSRAFVRNAFADEPAADPDRWALKFFSDNLVFGFPVGKEPGDSANAIALALRCVQGYQLQMALKGFFVRGAIAIGDICLTDEIVFGPALVECYQLESKASIVPRVVINETLRDAIAGHTYPIDHAGLNALEWVCRDVDGWWFVNYLDAAKSQSGIDWEVIGRHKAAVLSSLSETTRHDVLPKFGWTRRYHNVFCHWNQTDRGYSPEYVVERIDEQSTIQRLSDLRGSGM
jgi:hypothetical protein